MKKIATLTHKLDYVPQGCAAYTDDNSIRIKACPYCEQDISWAGAEFVCTALGHRITVGSIDKKHVNRGNYPESLAPIKSRPDWCPLVIEEVEE